MGPRPVKSASTSRLPFTPEEVRDLRAELATPSGAGTAARFGGDEFAIAFKGPLSDAKTRQLARKLIDNIGSVMTLGRHRHYPSLSAGIAYSTIESDIEGIFLGANAAMHKAKGMDGRRLAVFDAGMKDEIHSRMRMEGELSHALARGELLVHYQPEVLMLSGEVVGAEALVRWRHPERGLLAAGQFIEEAEEIGLITEIGELVLAEACAEAASWPGDSELPFSESTWPQSRSATNMKRYLSGWRTC